MKSQRTASFVCLVKRALVLFSFLLSSSAVLGANKWTSEVKKEFDDSQKWIDLIQSFKDEHFHYAKVAAAERMLQYFVDVRSKEFAYQTLIESIDQGYPFSLNYDFISGDLEETTSDSFAQSYNLYKATANSQKNFSKWAENYFNRVDKANFPKYLFYKALEAIHEKNTDEALKYLDQTLARTKGPEYASLAKKAARTLARILYEQTRYAQALEIYQTYLLKLNPVEPQDWIETGWSLYRLGKHEESLGFLYNMDSLKTGEVYPEQYIIRSLVYREKCDSIATASLGQTFERNFGQTLEGIKTGRSLKSYPILKRIYLGDTDYFKFGRVLKELDLEKKRIAEIPSKLRPLALFLMNSEIANLNHKRDSVEEDAYDSAARSLVILSESLKFLKFDVAREKFNPDKVFSPDPPPQTPVIVDNGQDSFEIHWLQWGDYWRDERQLYRAILKNRCE